MSKHILYAGDTALREAASKILDGMVLCGTLSPEGGLLLRSVSPRDGKSYYIESSRDQYTHFAHALWRYSHSPLADEAQRTTMRESIIAICTRMEQHMNPEHDFSICMEDGQPGVVDKMWHVTPHEVARLPMIYAIGADLTGDSHWWELYRRYARQAADESLLVPLEMRTPYAFLQEQVSLEPLYALENEDVALKDTWLRAMQFVAGRVEAYSWQCLDYQPVDVATLDMNWRHWPMQDLWGRLSPDWPEALLSEQKTVREPAEGLLTQLMCPDRPLSTDQHALMERMLGQTENDACITYALLYPLAAYWKAVAKGELRLP
jgi:hypothetical protein